MLNTLERKLSNISNANQRECVNRLILISQPLQYRSVSGNAGRFGISSLSLSLKASNSVPQSRLQERLISVPKVIIHPEITNSIIYTPFQVCMKFVYLIHMKEDILIPNSWKKYCGNQWLPSVVCYQLSSKYLLLCSAEKKN